MSYYVNCDLTCEDVEIWEEEEDDLGCPRCGKPAERHMSEDDFE